MFNKQVSTFQVATTKPFEFKRKKKHSLTSNYVSSGGMSFSTSPVKVTNIGTLQGSVNG